MDCETKKICPRHVSQISLKAFYRETVSDWLTYSLYNYNEPTPRPPPKAGAGSRPLLQVPKISSLIPAVFSNDLSATLPLARQSVATSMVFWAVNLNHIFS